MQKNVASLKTFLEEIISSGKKEKENLPHRVRNFSELADFIKEENKRKAELVMGGKLAVGNSRDYNKNMNWRKTKKGILEKYCSLFDAENVYLITATCRYMNVTDADWFMAFFKNICTYVVVAEKKKKYHLHYVVSGASNANYFLEKLKRFVRFKEKFAVDIEKVNIKKAISYLMKEVIREETQINYFSPKIK